MAMIMLQQEGYIPRAVLVRVLVGGCITVSVQPSIDYVDVSTHAERRKEGWEGAQWLVAEEGRRESGDAVRGYCQLDHSTATTTGAASVPIPAAAAAWMGVHNKPCAPV